MLRNQKQCHGGAQTSKETESQEHSDQRLGYNNPIPALFHVRGLARVPRKKRSRPPSVRGKRTAPELPRGTIPNSRLFCPSYRLFPYSRCLLELESNDAKDHRSQGNDSGRKQPGSQSEDPGLEKYHFRDLFKQPGKRLFSYCSGNWEKLEGGEFPSLGVVVVVHVLIIGKRDPLLQSLEFSPEANFSRFRFLLRSVRNSFSIFFTSKWLNLVSRRCSRL